MKRWRVLGKLKTKNLKLKTEDIIRVLLKNRGLKTKNQIQEFLNPLNPLTPLDPKKLEISKRELNKAVKRVKKAIKNKESIIVYSDFDADGVCGAAILWETLNSLGAKAMPYIPDRVKEGYGLSKKGIDRVLKDYGTSLIITVDQGITAPKKIEYAKKLGIDVIVTDHHVPPKKPPKALAVVHTTSLSGSGVAWVLARHLRGGETFHSGSGRMDSPGSVVKTPRGWQAEVSAEAMTPPRWRNLDHLAIVAIGTIADLIPLVGPSRSLVKYGLSQLNKTKRVGLDALFKEAGLEEGKIGTYEVGFIIAPRLNAAGRLIHAMDSLRLLCTRDPVRAESLAQKLGQTNRERQKLMGETTEHAKELLKVKGMTKFISLPKDNRLKAVTPNLIFLSHSSYHEGIIGLVAGKLVEQFYRPAIVVSKGEIFSKASARSINGFNIVEAIRKCSDLLVDCGGHPMAAGFTVETKYLKKVQSKLEQLAAKEIPQEKLTKTLKIDCEIDLADISFKLYRKISQFKPFGIGNPEPVFATRKVTVQDARTVGVEGKHLKLLVSDISPSSESEPPPRLRHLGGGRVERSGTSDSPEVEKTKAPWMVGRHDSSAGVTSVDAIAFNMGNLYPQLSPDKPIDIAYTILLDQWNNQKRLQLKIKDIKL